MNQHQDNNATFSSLSGGKKAVSIILCALGALVAYCYITRETSALGEAVSNVLFGLFACGAYMIPALLLLHGLFLPKDLVNKKVASRALLSLCAIVSVAMIGYAVFYLSTAINPSFDLGNFYTLGTFGKGGGAIGGAIAHIIVKIIGAIGLIIVLGIFLIIYLACFFSDASGMLGKASLGTLEFFANTGAFIENGIKGAFNKISNIKSENAKRVSEEKSADLGDDDFFMVNNGMQDFEISELGIKETRDAASLNESPMLHNKVRLKSTVDENDEAAFLKDVRLIEQENEQQFAAITEAQKPKKRKLFRVDVELDEEVKADNEAAEENVIYDEAPTPAPVRDDSADSVFGTGLDSFNISANEKLASKPSSRSRTVGTTSKEQAFTASNDISNITPEDVERARKQAEFDMKKRAFLDDYAKKNAAESSSDSSVREFNFGIAPAETSAPTVESVSAENAAPTAEEFSFATAPAVASAPTVESVSAENAAPTAEEFSFATAPAVASAPTVESVSAENAAPTAEEFSFATAPAVASAPTVESVSAENAAPTAEEFSFATAPAVASAPTVQSVSAENAALTAEEFSFATAPAANAFAQEDLKDEKPVETASVASEFEFEGETPKFETDIPPVVINTATEENTAEESAKADAEIHSAEERSFEEIISAAPQEPYSVESASEESYTAPESTYTSADEPEEDEIPSIEDAQAQDDFEPSAQELSEGEEEDGALDAPEIIPSEERNPKVEEYRNMFPILDEEQPTQAANNTFVFESVIPPETVAYSEVKEQSPAYEAQYAQSAEMSVSIEDEEQHVANESPITQDSATVVNDYIEDAPLEDEEDGFDDDSDDNTPPFDVQMPAPVSSYSNTEIIIEEYNEPEPPKPKKPDYSNFQFPPIDLLAPEEDAENESAQAEIEENAHIITETLKSFKAPASIKGVDRGPRITRYEIVPSMGIKTSSIMCLQNDLALNLAAEGIRMEAPIPGKSAIGLEIPNRHPATVRLRALLETDDFVNAKSKTTVCIGKDVSGCPVFGDIAKMPHVLIAGATGMGKSVCINSIMISMLYKARPDEVKFIMIDPKKVEFTMYNGIPHLLIPVVTDPKQAAGALMWAVEQMEKRYEILEKMHVRNIEMYNDKIAKDPTLGEPLPKIIVVVDELNDLMLQVRDPVEGLITSIAQKARAAGIHLIIGTQRPSVDVITGVIKANIPSRISCKVMSNTDSRTILDQKGAEDLLDKGDMLFFPSGKPKPSRVQGAFVSDGEVEEIMEFLKNQVTEGNYDDSVMEEITRNAQKCNKKNSDGDDDDDDESDDGAGFLNDQKFLDAVNVAVTTGKISTSLLQRKLSIGYGKAAKYVDIMEDMGIVSESNGQKAREVLITKDEWHEKLARISLDD